MSRLRTYRRELEGLYVQALARRDSAGARQLFDRRRSIVREILLREEWSDCASTSRELDAEIAAILQGA